MAYNNEQALSHLHSQFMDPPEDVVVAYDYKGDELYEGEEAFIIEGEYVREDDILDYANQYFDWEIVTGGG